MTDPKQNLDPGVTLYDTPPWLREQKDPADPPTVEHNKDKPAKLALRRFDESIARLRPIRGQDPRPRAQPDIFAEAVARAEQEQLDRELVEAPALFPSRRSSGIVAKFIIAVAAAAFVALICAVAFPDSQALLEDSASWGPPAWQQLKASILPASLPKPAPTLIVRDSKGSINELLEFGVSVQDPAPGMTVIIRKMPPGTKLTAGTQAGASEWRVPAQDIADAVITPPTDFIGEMNLSAELRGANGETLVASFVRPTWTEPPVKTAAAVASPAPASPVPAAPPPAVSPAPEPPPAVAPPPSAAAVIAPRPPPAEPIQELSANEIAGLVRRAQELLASGDLQEARANLKRAAEARDPRAALLLAKTFDPMALKQNSAADPRPDLAQARNWYQRAREWGSPEAQHQLDALASYPRR